MASHHNGAVLDLVHPQDARLRRVQDGRRHKRAVDPAVRDGERAALHIGHGQLVIPRAGTHFGDLLFDASKAHLVSIAQHGYDKAVGRAHGNPHVDVVFINHILPVDFGIDLGNFLQGVDTGFDEKRHEAQLHAVLLFKDIFVGVAQLHHARHVDLVIGGQHGGGVLRVFQALGDGGTQAGHLDALFTGGIVSRNGRAGDGGRGRCGGCSGRRGSGGLGHVFLHDAAIAACTGDLGRGQARFGHGFLGGGGVFDVFANGRHGGGNCGRCSFGGCYCGGSTFGHNRQARACGHGGAFGGDDLGQNASNGAGHFDRNLIGFQLAQHFVYFHHIARLFEPCRYGRLSHAFAQ